MLLAINTATSQNEVAIISSDKTCICQSWQQQGNEAEMLLPKVNELLSSNNLRFHDIKEILVVTGPGPFSSVRVGVTAANATGFALSIPVKSLTTFELFEKSLKAEATVVRASKSQLFVKRRDEKPRILSNTEAVEFIKEYQLTVAGDMNPEQEKLLDAAEIHFLSSKNIFEKLAEKIDFSELKSEKTAQTTYFKDPNISKSKKPLSLA